MNFKKMLLSALFAGAVVAQVGAQCPSPVSSLVISTGYDPGSSSVLNPTAGNPLPDPMWRLMQSPAPPPPWNVTIGGPAWVIAKYSSWDAAGSTSQYINAFNTSSSVLDNWNSGTIPYIFEREFCICDPNGLGTSYNVNFDLRLHADNWAEVELVDNGGTVITNLLSQPFSYTTANFLNPTNNANVNQSLTPGTYTLRLYLRNKSVAMGVALDGTISSPGLLSDAGCNPEGTIVGVKYNDCDQSGTISAGDPFVQGINIELKDGSGTVVQTATTDQYGVYFFNNVTPGTYTVEEVLTAGWTAVSPASGIHTGVSVVAAGVTTLDFLNYNPDECGSQGGPCEGFVTFNGEMRQCGGQFIADLSNIPGGQQVVSTLWTFGDQTSSNELNPYHYYEVPGNYTVCLEVLTFDGEQCCTYEHCVSITIEEACEEACEFNAEVLVNYNERDCTYDFVAAVNYAGVPVTNWFWDFGDGTSGIGSTISGHQFPGPGTYNVCVTLFGVAVEGRDCCFETFCVKVDVDCNPCEGGGKAKREAVEEPGNSMMFYPNPSDGEFTLQLELADEAPVAIEIIDLKGAVLYQEDLGVVNAGSNNFRIGAELPSGMYIAKVTAGEEQMNHRLMIK
ncbi:MAG: PKD domain-containing protein [Salibacteraceae bacterium]